MRTATAWGSGWRGAPSEAGPEARVRAPEAVGMPITLTLELRGLGCRQVRCVPSSDCLQVAEMTPGCCPEDLGGILARPRSPLGRRTENRGRKRKEGRGCLEKKQKVEDRKEEEERDGGRERGKLRQKGRTQSLKGWKISI